MKELSIILTRELYDFVLSYLIRSKALFLTNFKGLKRNVL